MSVVAGRVRRRRSGYCAAGKYGKGEHARKTFLYYV